MSGRLVMCSTTRLQRKVCKKQVKRILSLREMEGKKLRRDAQIQYRGVCLLRLLLMERAHSIKGRHV